MKRILLLMEHQQNRNFLAEWLKEQYQVLSPGTNDDFVTVGAQLLHEPFNVCLIDFAAIEQLRPQMLARRAAEVPIFLPFVFFTPQQDISLATDHLEPLIDDVVHLPIKKSELQTRLRVLLRSHSYSLQLQSTQQQLNQALLQEQELNQLKSRFVSTVSHEFRNPLNGISGMTQLLQAYGDRLNPEKKAEILAGLRRNVTKMTKLINDVLEISRQDMGKISFNPAPVDLEQYCRGLVSEIQIAFDHQQRINFLGHDANQKLNLDGDLLHHILTNLLSNACKYSPEEHPVDFQVWVKDQKITFTISDRGIGIPPADLPRLFESFYRASNSENFQGTGLGLAIAQEYVEIHHGVIDVVSELNVGTTFTVTIPVDHEQSHSN